LDAVWRALSGIKVENANSFIKTDRDRILSLVKDGPGYARVNKEIISHLHSWFATNSEGHLRERLALEAFEQPPDGPRVDVGDVLNWISTARACCRVGDMLERVSRYPAARQILEKGYSLFSRASALETIDGVVLMRVYGTVLRRLGNSDEALSMYKKAQEVHKQLGTEVSNEFAVLLQDLGRLHGDLSNLDLELNCHTDAYRIREKLGTLQTQEGAGLMRSLGMVYFQTYDYKQALELFELSRDMYEKKGSLTTPEGAATLQSIGDVLSSMPSPRLEDALAAHEHAYNITEQLGIGGTPRGVVQLRRLAFLYTSTGNKKKAREMRALASATVKDTKKRRERERQYRRSATTKEAPRSGVAVGREWVGKRLSATCPDLGEKCLSVRAEDSADMNDSWGVFFEVTNDEAYIDPELRGFPHSLVSFETIPTVGLSANHINIAWGSTETLTVEGREWSLHGDALDQTPALQQLHEVVKDSAIVGYLSPLHGVNLSDTAKERAAIPSSARYFMFSYPVRIKIGEAAARAPRSSDPDLAFLRNGGYVYLDASITRIVGMNAVLPSATGGLRFGPPLKWELEWSNRLVTAGRFRPITMDEISKSGATHFCWIRPNEVMWFGSSGGASICPYGGFAYIRRPARDDRRGLKRPAEGGEHFTPTLKV